MKKHLEICEGLKEEIGMNIYLHRPTTYAKTHVSCGEPGPAKNTQEVYQ